MKRNKRSKQRREKRPRKYREKRPPKTEWCDRCVTSHPTVLYFKKYKMWLCDHCYEVIDRVYRTRYVYALGLDSRAALQTSFKMKQLPTCPACASGREGGHDDCWAGAEFMIHRTHFNCNCQICYNPERLAKLTKFLDRLAE